jgi:hypothetical protein
VIFAAGISTAADVDWRVGHVSGIGPTRQAALIAWKTMLEAEARQSAPSLSPTHRYTIESKYRNQRQAHEAAKLQIEKELRAKMADIRQYFDQLMASQIDDERQLRTANEQETNRIQEEYSIKLGSLDDDLSMLKRQGTPAIDDISEKLAIAEKQVLAVRWKSAKQKSEGRRFDSLRFRDYLQKIFWP